jgi:hypothetical protein
MRQISKDPVNRVLIISDEHVKVRCNFYNLVERLYNWRIIAV